MDKNTLYGLLMMGLVIFGFMYINNKDQQKAQQQLQEQAEKQQQQEAIAARKSLTVDSIRPEELAGIASGRHSGGGIRLNLGRSSTLSYQNGRSYRGRRPCIGHCASQ